LERLRSNGKNMRKAVFGTRLGTMPILDLLLTPLAAGASVPAVTYATEALAALLPPRGVAPDASPAPSFAVLVPAHDEAGTIGPTVRALRSGLGGVGRLLVVADNCRDGTAAEARAAGAEVTERHDPERRGKGYAISHGLDQLAAAPPAAVVIVDADCRVSPGGLERLAAVATATGRPVQASYLLHAPNDPPPARRVSAFAIQVKNHLRPRGLARLGLPCVLTGSGMAFPWPLLRDAPATQGEIVEDLVLGLTLARRGAPPLFLDEVRVTSPLPTGDEAAASQRRRWEHGFLGSMVGHGPGLLAAGLRRGDLRLVGAALDLSVPPLVLLVGGLGAGTLVSTGLAATGLASPAPAVLFGGGLAAVVGTTGILWWRYGREVLPPRDLAVVVRYAAQKLPLYRDLARGRREHRWVRTTRDDPDDPRVDGTGSPPVAV